MTKRIRMVLAMLPAIFLAAQANAAINSFTDEANNPNPENFFLELGTGISFPNKVNISPDPSQWDASPQGYNNSLSIKPLYMAGIGYNFDSLYSFDLSGTYRGEYQYQKFQTSTAVGTPGFSGDKTRFFDLSSMSILFNATLYGQEISKDLIWNTGSVGFIQPFLGTGLGVSYNTVSNFHSITTNGTTASILANNTSPSFAYQFNAGLEWQYERMGVDVGYRYFNAGSFQSNNYIIGVAGAGSISTWKSTLGANEIFLTLKVAI